MASVRQSSKTRFHLFIVSFYDVLAATTTYIDPNHRKDAIEAGHVARQRPALAVDSE
jgi:hypothetical protein